MKGKSKRKFTADSKLKRGRSAVVLEALKEKDTLAAISKRYKLHSNQISDWKSALWSRLAKSLTGQHI